MPTSVAGAPGLLALGHLHGVNTAPNPKADPDDLALARDLMRTCYELYARSPTGLAPEIAHFTQREGGDAAWPKRHAQDVGGGDFTIKPQVRARPTTSKHFFRHAGDALGAFGGKRVF
jgi:hypothetical protein